MNRMHPDTVDRLCDSLMIDQYTLAAIWEISGWEPEEQILGDHSSKPVSYTHLTLPTKA